jgi:hypothetical protein
MAETADVRSNNSPRTKKYDILRDLFIMPIIMRKFATRDKEQKFSRKISHATLTSKRFFGKQRCQSYKFYAYLNSGGRSDLRPDFLRGKETD